MSVQVARRAVVRQVEPKLGVAMTTANLRRVQASRQTGSGVWDVIVMAATAAMETGTRLMAATLWRRRDREEPRLDAGEELA
jgi:hypothetical protein